MDESVAILANGIILTMNPNQPNAPAIAVKGGKILEVGDLAKVKKPGEYHADGTVTLYTFGETCGIE